MTTSRTSSFPDTRPNRISTALIAVASVAMIWQGAIAAPRLEEPARLTGQVPQDFYGDATNVKMLVDLAEDEDPRVRERCIHALGETHNYLAMPSIYRAIEDSNANVRCAAIGAAVNYNDARTASIINKGLADKNRRVVLTALRIAAHVNLSASTNAIAALCKQDDPIVQAAAVMTLSKLKIDPESDLLKTLMESPSATVRLRAAQCINASDSITDKTLASSLLALFGPDQPNALRGEAIAAVGKLDFSAASDAVTDAGRSDNPFLRRGALLALQAAGKKDMIRRYLSDPSPMVVLAAVKATGALKNADDTERLMDILIQTPAPDLHLAARHSLEQLGADVIIKPTGARLQALSADLNKYFGDDVKLTPKIKTDRAFLSRNMRSLCYLLGTFKSKEKFELRIKLFNSLKIYNDIHLDLVPSLAATGLPQAADALIARLPYCNDRGAYWLYTLTLPPPPPPVDYNEAVHAAIIDAVADIGVKQGIDEIIGAIKAHYNQKRLQAPVAAASRALAVMATPEVRKQIEDAAILVLSTDQFSRTSQYAMSLTAGQLKLKGTTEALRRLLEEQRYSKPTMAASAWAIQEITGITPTVGEPKVNQPTRPENRWIVQKNEE